MAKKANTSFRCIDQDQMLKSRRCCTVCKAAYPCAYFNSSSIEPRPFMDDSLDKRDGQRRRYGIPDCGNPLSFGQRGYCNFIGLEALKDRYLFDSYAAIPLFIVIEDLRLVRKLPPVSPHRAGRRGPLLRPVLWVKCDLPRPVTWQKIGRFIQSAGWITVLGVGPTSVESERELFTCTGLDGKLR
jgi:hypothetical protein